MQYFDLYARSFDVQPQAQVTVATVTDLGSYDVSALENGAMAFVASLNAYFTLAASTTATPLQAVVLASTEADRYWFRSTEVSKAWDAVTVFYIDGAAGNDGNDGQTALTAVRTLDEITRRTYRPESPRTAFFEIRVGAGGASGSFVTNCYCEFYGTPTAESQDVEITAASAFARNPYVAMTVTAAVDWANATNKLLSVSTGGGTLYGFMTDSAPGTGTVMLWDSSSPPLATAPTAGDTISVYELPLINGSITGVGKPYIGFYDCRIALSRDMEDVDAPSFERCIISGLFESCGTVFFKKCRLQGLRVNGTSDAVNQALFTSCVFRGNNYLGNETARFLGDCSITGSDTTLELNSKAHLIIVGGLELRSVATPILLQAGGARLYLDQTPDVGSVNTVYGNGVGIGFYLNYCDTLMFYRDETSVVATFTTAAWKHLTGDGAGGTVTGAFTEPPLPSAAAISTAMTGILRFA